MAEHGDRLQELRKRIVERRRGLVTGIINGDTDGMALWSDLLKIDAILLAVDRFIKDEESQRPSVFDAD